MKRLFVLSILAASLWSNPARAYDPLDQRDAESSPRSGSSTGSRKPSDLPSNPEAIDPSPRTSYPGSKRVAKPVGYREPVDNPPPVNAIGSNVLRAPMNNDYRPPEGTYVNPPEVHANQNCLARGWYAGAGFYMVEPFWRNNTALVIRDSSLSLSQGVIQSFDFNYDVSFSPRFWLGYVNDCGLGVRGRYWRFDQGAEESLVAGDSGMVLLSSDWIMGLGIFAPGAGDALIARSTLKLDVVDMEATQDVNFGFCSLVYSAGLRYGKIRQGYDVALVSAEELEIGEVLQSSRSFEGIGPTVSYEFRRPIGCGFSLYHSSRVAVLFGREHDRAALTLFSELEPDSVAIPTERKRNGFLPMGEIELGGEWFHKGKNVDVGIQAAFVGMVYDSIAFPGLTMMFSIYR